MGNFVLGECQRSITAERELESKSQINSESEKEYFNKKDLEYLEYEHKYLVSYGQKATKGDDEKVPVELWDRNIVRDFFPHLTYNDEVAKAFDVLRNKIGFKWYLRCLRKSLFAYLKETYGKNYWRLFKMKSSRKRNPEGLSISAEFRKDIQVARDAVKRAAESTWWEWCSGST